jgi:hypothetical protein
MLKRLYQDKATLEALRQYFYEKINQKALSNLYAGKDVQHFAEARKLVDVLFNEMDSDFGDKTKKPNISDAL